MMADRDFWLAVDRLVEASTLIIDRPKGSPHPRHGSWRYPLDYGYLEETRAPDGDGIDVWRGSLTEARVTGVIVTVDLDKGDGEFKLLLGCTAKEAQMALDVHNQGSQAGIRVSRPDTVKESTHV
jgi:inorganic pyrophosphatase